MRTIALEEHFVSQQFIDATGIDMGGQTARNLDFDQAAELGSVRLGHMDDSGIDMQVISHVWPTFQPHTPDQELEITRAANAQVHAAVSAHPDRFAAFAALPMSDPAAAVTELDRTVTELGFKGALINGRADGRFLDDPILFPILERAQALKVPLYLHPGLPTETLRQELYSDLDPSVGFGLGVPAWGWHAEAGLHALRLIVSRVFDRLPDLQIILGHMGEMIPFMLERIEDMLTPAAQRAGLQRTVADTFCSNFWVTTSGMFSQPPFLLLLQVVGADRILFSVDYPFSSNNAGRAFLDAIAVSPADKEKISHLNAEHLLDLPAR
jgi:predicted TIM-barrel fold metal-dependent hydrolase